MTNFEKELMKAIEEVATSTNMTVDECIRQAIELLNKQSYEKRLYENMFRGW